mgnify:CR=1 FL=1
MLEGIAPPVTKRPPHGFHAVRLDANGRLKMPAKVVEYLQLLEDKILFATYFQGLPRIFANGSWERYLAKLDGDRALKKRIAFYCESVGADVELDKQDRLTLPPQLREEAKLGEQVLRLRFDQDDVITLYPEESFKAKQQEFLPSLGQDQERAASMGFDL